MRAGLGFRGLLNGSPGFPLAFLFRRSSCGRSRGFGSLLTAATPEAVTQAAQEHARDGHSQESADPLQEGGQMRVPKRGSHVRVST